jgi:DNA end-binding protein Ku
VRPTWSGSISFGLVNIPVKLYTAVQDHGGIKFRFLHEKDLSPVGYAKVCKAEGVEITQDEIVRGYEYEKDEFVVIEDEDFKRAATRKSRAVEILDFVNADEVDTVYHEKPYYLEPDRGADKPYSLLLETLRRSNKVGVAKFVLKDRENLAIIKPYGKVLALIQLRFADEVRGTSEIKVDEIDAEGMSRELDMAQALVEQMSSTFMAEQYRDTYTQELREVIEEKVKGKAPSARGEEPAMAEVTDLMEALKASLKKDGQGKKAVA